MEKFEFSTEVLNLFEQLDKIDPANSQCRADCRFKYKVCRDNCWDHIDICKEKCRNRLSDCLDSCYVAIKDVNKQSEAKVIIDAILAAL